jgi:hypothetical protein
LSSKLFASFPVAVTISPATTTDDMFFFDFKQEEFMSQEEKFHKDNQLDASDDGKVDYLLDDMILSKKQMEDLLGFRKKEIKSGTTSDPTSTLPTT